ncbi:MAG: S8 family serine peptidase, partial [Deltaproteobacteria bacterium]|nr:S8 family serine peptidase [Deltaproteobacteria bacterium]
PDIDCPNANTQGTGSGASNYMVSCKGGLPNGFADIVAANGDKLLRSVPEVGLALVKTANPTAYEIGSCEVAEDLSMQMIDPVQTVELDQEANPPSAGDDETYFWMQWGHDAVNAPEAWNAGVRGQCVRVAVLDTGFDLDHPDLLPNINFDLSQDFTGEGLQYTLSDPFSHGTHTAGTIAAADNDWGSIGVAPDAELVLLKVLGDEGSGSFFDLFDAIVYAAGEADVDVINMSLGATICTGYHKAGLFVSTMTRVVNYAKQKGVVVIAAAGNDAYDLDHLWDCQHLPSDLAGVQSISATAPYGWAYELDPDLDVPASYTNYGQSTVAFAAPGGDFDFPYDYWWYDMVLSTGNGGWYWSAGTSMAAPHAAGIAALIISEGGNTSPAAVLSKMRKRADDLGKSGQDDYYGAGRVSSGY